MTQIALFLKDNVNGKQLAFSFGYLLLIVVTLTADSTTAESPSTVLVMLGGAADEESVSIRLTITVVSPPVTGAAFSIVVAIVASVVEQVESGISISEFIFLTKKSTNTKRTKISGETYVPMRIRKTVSLPQSSQTLLETTIRFLVVSQNLSNNKHLVKLPDRTGN